MNKKLLLSFAVFATALSVNAQKRGIVNIPKTTFKEVVSVNDFQTEEFLNKKNNVNSKKRTVVPVTDTIRLVSLKKIYGCPNSAFVTDRPIMSKVYLYKGDKYNVGISQTFNTTVQTKLKGVGVKLVTWKQKDVDFLVEYKTLKNVDTVVKMTSNVPAYSTSTDYFFTFPTPILSKDTITITVKPNSVTDSILVYTTGIYNQKSKAYGKISNDTLTIDQTKITNSNFTVEGFYKGWLFDKTGYPYGGGFAPAFTILSGKNILPGTKVLKQIGAYQYIVDKKQTVALDSVFGSVAVLDENDTYGFQSVLKTPATGNPTVLGASLWDNGIDSYFSDAYIYPIVDYNFETSALGNDLCLTSDKSIKIDLDTTKLKSIVKSSIFNKNAFYSKYLKMNKVQSSFANLYAKSDSKYADTLDFLGNSFSKTYSDDSKNDTLVAVEYILGYGYKVALGYKDAVSYFKVSSKMTATTTPLVPAHANKTDGKAVVLAKGGYVPYTYAWKGSTVNNDTVSLASGAQSVTVTDANGCKLEASVTVALSSVAELGLTNIAVYPNPVKETLNVRFDAKSIATVELVSVAGQVLDTKTDSDVTFNTAGLVSGIYFVNIKVAEGVYTHKIIKE